MEGARLRVLHQAARALGAAGGADADADAVVEVAESIAETAGLSLGDEGEEWGDIYRDIGVTPVINATGSVTILGGSTPHPEVADAMDRANSAFVPLWELQKTAGAAIAGMVGVPAALVSSGCGGAMMLAAAAAIAGDDVEAIEALPNTASLAKDEILIMSRQRYKFDRCFEAAGAKMVNFGEPTGPISIDEMVAAIGPRTCAVAYVANENHADPYPYDYSKGPLLELEDIIRVAKEHGLKVIVDAAGQIFPLENIGKYVQMGADASCVACKYMGASQSSGVLLGTEEFVHSALLNSFTGYEAPGLNGDLSDREEARGAGRPQKVDRQEMVGTWAAVKRWTQTVDHEERKARIRAECDVVVAPLEGVSSCAKNLLACPGLPPSACATCALSSPFLRAALAQRDIVHRCRVFGARSATASMATSRTASPCTSTRRWRASPPTASWTSSRTRSPESGSAR